MCIGIVSEKIDETAPQPPDLISWAQQVKRGRNQPSNKHYVENLLDVFSQLLEGYCCLVGRKEFSRLPDVGGCSP